MQVLTYPQNNIWPISGVSVGTQEVDDQLFNAMVAFPSSSIYLETDQERFYNLLSTWKEETGHLSILSKKFLHPAYQEIIGMGKDAVPLLLFELEKKPDHLFWALRSITGANPIPESAKGNLKLMADAWLKWGAQSSYLK